MRVWLLLVSLWVVPCGAAPAVKVNQVEVSAALLDILFSEQSQLDKKAFTLSLVDTLLLYQYAQTHFDDPNWQSSGVGYSANWHINKRRRAILAQLYPELALERLSKGYQAASIDEKALSALFSEQNILGISLTPEQRAKAKVMMLEVSETQTISVLALFSELSLQEKQRLMKGDYSPLLVMLKSLWLDQRQRLWFETGDRLAEWQSVHQVAAATYLRGRMLNVLGVKKRHHGDNPGLTSFKANITEAQIAWYYAQNKHKFRYLKKVKARYISGDEGSQRLKTHQFKWVERNSLNNQWLSDLLFASLEQGVRGPVRSPDGKHYWLEVVEGQYDFFDPKSETVRYQAREVLALEAAISAYKQLLIELRANNEVRYANLG